MNTLAECVKNYLVLVDSPEYKQQLYKLCLEKVKDGCLIVLITSQIHDFSTIITDLLLNKDQLKKFIIMYFNTIDDICRKLLLLHSWSLLPYMIVVDLSHLLNCETEVASSSATLMQKVALSAVSLLAYLESVALKATTIANATSSNNTVNGILILRKEGEHFGETQIQIIKDLYFYKTEMLENVDAIRDMILKIESNL